MGSGLKASNKFAQPGYHWLYWHTPRLFQTADSKNESFIINSQPLA